MSVSIGQREERGGDDDNPREEDGTEVAEKSENREDPGVSEDGEDGHIEGDHDEVDIEPHDGIDDEDNDGDVAEDKEVLGESGAAEELGGHIQKEADPDEDIDDTDGETLLEVGLKAFPEVAPDPGVFFFGELTPDIGSGGGGGAHAQTGDTDEHPSEVERQSEDDLREDIDGDAIGEEFGVDPEGGQCPDDEGGHEGQRDDGVDEVEKQELPELAEVDLKKDKEAFFLRRIFRDPLAGFGIIEQSEEASHTFSVPFV